MQRITLTLLFLCTACATTRSTVATGTPEERSDAASAVLLETLLRFSPEFLSRLGLPGHDGDIADLKPDNAKRFRAALAEVKGDLDARRAAETDDVVRQDLDILLKKVELLSRESDVEERTLLPYENLHKKLFIGISGLLDASMPAERRQAALTRIRRYAGIEPGTEPIVELAQARLKERFADKALAGPVREDVEKDLADGATYKAALQKLVEKFGDETWKGPLVTLEHQLDGYDAFVKAEVLSRARAGFRLPPELYRIKLEGFGIDLDPTELSKRAHAAFDETRAQMQALAGEVAKARGFASSDYVSVIKKLKEEQVTGPEVLKLFEGRIKEVEDVIRREKLVTLPERPMLFRIASEAETAEQPAPHVDPRGLFSHDKNVRLTFVLPLNVGGNLKYDDWTYVAGSWTITAHEGRPGHDLQLSKVTEKGLTRARTLFAFNSTNVEGWALYAEQLMRPYMPPDARLVSLQALLLREARAFLDPELQAGTVTPEQARAVLTDQVVASPALAEEEIQRFTFNAPGQAPSYFYGWTRINGLRAEVEKALGPKFEAQRFHDTLLDQGLLPPTLLEQAVKKALTAN
jgi:uncharacterized protein (DUF885 family)